MRLQQTEDTRRLGLQQTEATTNWCDKKTGAIKQADATWGLRLQQADATVVPTFFDEDTTFYNSIDMFINEVILYRRDNVTQRYSCRLDSPYWLYPTLYPHDIKNTWREWFMYADVYQNTVSTSIYILFSTSKSF